MGDSIIIKRIKKVSGGGHGGAWKVAYADFVTAMMAFFLLLWLLSTASEEQLQGISKYFTPDLGFSGGKSVKKVDDLAEKDTQNSEVKVGKDTVLKSDVKQDDKYLLQLKGEIENFLSQVYLNNNVVVKSVPDGIAIEISDQEKGSFLFNKNGFEILPKAKKAIDDLIDLLKYVPRYISVTGHTSKNESGKWLLSVRRADSMRAYFEKHGITDRIAQLSGVGSFKLIDEIFPNSPRNRRVVIILLKNSIIPFSVVG